MEDINDESSSLAMTRTQTDLATMPPLDMNSLATSESIITQVRALRLRLAEGDQSAVEPYRAMQKAGHIPEVALSADTLIARTINAICYERDLMGRTTLAVEADSYVQQLEGASPTVQESLVARLITLGWLQIIWFEGLYANQIANLSSSQEKLYQRRIDGAHRRFLQATKTLATIRRLPVTPLQVNIGQANVAQNQVNTASTMLADHLAPIDSDQAARMAGEITVQCLDGLAADQAD